MPAKKKSSLKKSPTVSVEGAIPKLRMDFPLDEKKIAQIQRCLAKGKLSISVSRVDLASKRLGDPWLYD
jgi:hypothetical protein